ncbi:MAG: polyphosphate--glucose phosphotransferase [Saprospiraceae bacterium]
MAIKKKFILGIDIGGTGIKAGLVDIVEGTLLGEPIKIKTPSPSTPQNVFKAVQQVITMLNYTGPVGIGFPAIVHHAVIQNAANIDKKWIGTNAETLFNKIKGCRFHVANDADMAGMAEMAFGLGKNKKGTVILITIGTGLGSALFIDGKLVPNTEFGHLNYKKADFEYYASNTAREKKRMSWANWGGQFNRFMQHLEFIFSPDMIILGGGLSKRWDDFKKKIEVDTVVIPAKLQNHAGIIGAAAFAKSLG